AASSSAGGPAGMTSEGLGWSEPDQSYATGLQLEISIAPAAHGNGTVIRADGMGEWLDPQPRRDTTSGRRLRVRTAGPCPGSDRRMVGVTNEGADLSARLLPEPRPTGGLSCEVAPSKRGG